MKLLISTLCLLAYTWTARAQEAPKEWIQVTSTNTTPVILGTNTVAKTFVLTGVTTGGVNNTGRVWIKQSSSTNRVGWVVMPGQVVSVTVDATRARRWDLYVLSETSGDGVSVSLLQ